MLYNLLMSEFAGNFVISHWKLGLVIVSENGVSMIWILTGGERGCRGKKKGQAILFLGFTML